MAALSFALIAFRRLKSRWGLTLLLTFSIACAIGLLSCIPIFSGAVSLRIIQQELQQRAGRKSQPLMSLRIYAMGSRSRPISLQDADAYGLWLRDLVSRELGLPVDSVQRRVEGPSYRMLPATDDSRYTKALDSVMVVHIDDLAAHIDVEGQPLVEPEPSEVMSVWIERAYADGLALQIGERFILERTSTRDLDDLEVCIAGFWTASDRDDHWWYQLPEAQFRHALVTTRGQYERHVYPRLTQKAAFCGWYLVCPDRRVNLGRAEQYVQALERIDRLVEERLPDGSMDNTPVEELVKGQERKVALTLVLLGFSVPVIVIMIYFIGVLSSLMVRFQQLEIAVFASRGSSRGQIVLLTLVETLVILAVATPAGVWLGMQLARLLGYARGFFRFVPGEPLPVLLTSLDWRLVGAAVLVMLASRLIPAWRAAGTSVVQQEQSRARRRLVLGATRLFGMAALAAASYYAYQQLAKVGTLGLVSWEPGDPQHDPLLLLAPSLFLLTAPLIASELFVWLAWPLSWLGRLFRSLAAYLGLNDLGREGGAYRTPIYMLVLCLSLGIFYASLAKSADQWLVDRRAYQVGSDLTFTTEIDSDLESYGLTSAEVIEVLGSPSNLPIEAYEAIDGVAQAMPLGEYRLSYRSGRYHRYVQLMAIDRIRFPSIAHFRRDYAKAPLGELMNALGVANNGVLMPQAMLDDLELQIGDTIKADLRLEDDSSHALAFQIVGAIDYFPTWIDREQEPVWVCNLDHISLETSNMLPYGIWMRLEEGTIAHDVLQTVRDSFQLKTGMVGDLLGTVGDDQIKLERVGIFGMLSVCFFAGALMSGLGLLVQSTATMRGRSLRFAILQALGMARGTLVGTLFVEYLAVLGYAILAGMGLGILTAQLYGPFFQLTDEKAIPIPPYLPLVDQERAMLLAAIMAFTLIIIETALVITLLRTKVFESLRLGMKE